MKIYCCTENRRKLIETSTDLNGIDFIEVLPAEILNEKQKSLEITFLNSLETPIEIDQVFLTVDGQLSGIVIEELIEDASNMSIVLKLSDRGDFSIYTLHLMENWEEKVFLPGFDKILSSIEFSFKVACFTDLDCKPVAENCGEKESINIPEINYLAKDYASFKQLLLDRLSFLLPGWTERNATDLGITLVEILAYVGDYLSYRQDAITTEAYLKTSRKRISVKRHARLIDYYMHDGINARTWIQIKAGEDAEGVTIKREDETGFITKFLTTSEILKNEDLLLSKVQFDKIVDPNVLVFEPLYDLQLFTAHNKISFHTYGEQNCCIPKGATEATLKGRLEDLKINDVLILEEILGPKTGSESDANPENRHAIKITEISIDTDFDFSETPAQVIDITIIKWSEEDAMPFPLCTSAVLDVDAREEVFEVSVARGNVVLADHGSSFSDMDVVSDEVPFDNLESSLSPSLMPKNKYYYANASSGNSCETVLPKPIVSRFNPKLKAYPLTHSERINFIEDDASDLNISAKKMLKQDIRNSIPAIYLNEILETGSSFEIKDDSWRAVKDLLIDSSLLDPHFVVEMEGDGSSYLRFGNDINGKLPDAGSKFLATYRIGNGSLGNVGRNAVSKIVYDTNVAIESITNPLPAVGGKNPETKEEVKQYAPQAFRTQERAVISTDYEDVSKRCKEDIQSVTAKFRWTGSWQTTYIAADRLNGAKVTAQWEDELRDCLQKYRLAGVDLEVEEPLYVGLEMDIKICIAPNTFKMDIHNEVTGLLSNKVLKNGQKGFFHPDNLIFGQTLYLSKLYALVQEVEGVVSVSIEKFQRYGIATSTGLNLGKLDFGRNEIPRLDNDPNHIELGKLTLEIQGGR